MTVTIRPDHEEEGEWLNESKAAVNDKIERAFGQFDRREFFSADQSGADMEKRKAEWLRERG
jgi:hypothetical protein